MKQENIIISLSKSENVSENTMKEYIKAFEKYIKKEIKKYDDSSGLEDFKMNKYDYNILFELYNNTKKSQFKIHIILLYMYSFYKLDGIAYDIEYFPVKLFFDFINNNENIHSTMFNLISCKNK